MYNESQTKKAFSFLMLLFIFNKANTYAPYIICTNNVDENQRIIINYDEKKIYNGNLDTSMIKAIKKQDNINFLDELLNVNI